MCSGSDGCDCGCDNGCDCACCDDGGGGSMSYYEEYDEPVNYSYRYSAPDLHWTEEQKKSFSREMEAYRRKHKNDRFVKQTNTTNKYRKENAIWEAISVFVGCNIITLLLNWLIYPIAFIFIHDCGNWFCSHTFHMSWASYLITLLLLIVVVSFLITMENEQKESLRYNQNSSVPGTSHKVNRRTHNNDNLETDYYDEDMEGAPGYYGND